MVINERRRCRVGGVRRMSTQSSLNGRRHVRVVNVYARVVLSTCGFAACSRRYGGAPVIEEEKVRGYARRERHVVRWRRWRVLSLSANTEVIERSESSNGEAQNANEKVNVRYDSKSQRHYAGATTENTTTPQDEERRLARTDNSGRMVAVDEGSRRRTATNVIRNKRVTRITVRASASVRFNMRLTGEIEPEVGNQQRYARIIGRRDTQRAEMAQSAAVARSDERVVAYCRTIQLLRVVTVMSVVVGWYMLRRARRREPSRRRCQQGNTAYHTSQRYGCLHLCTHRHERRRSSYDNPAKVCAVRVCKAVRVCVRSARTVGKAVRVVCSVV